MQSGNDRNSSRRDFLRNGAALAGLAALHTSESAFAQGPAPLEVASAGSIRAMLEGPLQQQAATDLGLALHVHAGGADGVAKSLVDGTTAADVFIPITATPMRTVLAAGKVEAAYPIARTEMVILYSPKSRFVDQFKQAAEGKAEWWRVLQQPGLKFARSNPLEDPSGRAILFVMMLAAKKYGQADLCDRILGAPMNPNQIQTGSNLRTALENGQIDALGSYRIATRQGSLPYLALPADINLSDDRVQAEHPDLTLQIGDKTFRPDPLIFYAAALRSARNPEGATRFVDWLRSARAAELFTANGFSSPCTDAKACPALIQSAPGKHNS